MSRLSSFFPLAEMARTAGSMAKTTRAALERARQSGEEFSVEQFCKWLIDAGVDGPPPGVDPHAFIKRMAMSVNQRVKKLAVDPESGERPNAMHPLVQTRAGRRGPGGAGLYRYVFDGPPGVAIKGVSKPEPEDDEDIPFADDDDVGMEPEPTPEPPKAKMPPNLLPSTNKADWAEWGPSPAEETMVGLADVGYGPDHEIWPQIAKAQNDAAVSKILGQSGVPSILRPRIVRIAKHIFNQMGRDYETGGVVAAAPAQVGAGDRKYGKGWQGKPKAVAPEPEPEPEVELEPDDYEDEGEFIDAEPDEDPVTAQQAGASNFVKPDAPKAEPPKAATPAPPKKPGVSNIANLMKKFGAKR